MDINISERLEELQNELLAIDNSIGSYEEILRQLSARRLKVIGAIEEYQKILNRDRPNPDNTNITGDGVKDDKNSNTSKGTDTNKE